MLGVTIATEDRASALLPRVLALKFNKRFGTPGGSELSSCVKVEVDAVLGSPSLTVFMVSVDVKQH